MSIRDALRLNARPMISCLGSGVSWKTRADAMNAAVPVNAARASHGGAKGCRAVRKDCPVPECL